MKIDEIIKEVLYKVELETELRETIIRMFLEAARVDRDKKEVISRIMEFHPSYGAEKKYSWYVGGMRDTGAWYMDKLQDEDLGVLKIFLKYIETSENRNNEANRKRLEESNRVNLLPEKERSEYWSKVFKEERDRITEYFQGKEMNLLWGKPGH